MKKCFVCNKKEGITNFSDATFTKCVQMIAYRRVKDFKYGNLKLSRDLLSKVGFHSRCYKKVSVLKGKLKDEFEAFCQANIEGIEAGDSLESRPEFGETKFQFEAVKEEPGISETELEEISKQYQQEVEISTPTNKFTTPCIFCKKVQKKVGLRRQYVTISNSPNTLSKIKQYAEALEDFQILNVVQDCNALAYHGTCYSTYILKLERSKPKEKGIWHELREVHKGAFAALSAFIVEEIVKKDGVFFLTDLYSRYKALLLEVSDNKFCQEDFENYRADNLGKKILQSFGDIVVIQATDTTYKKRIVFKKEIGVLELIGESLARENSERTKFENLAYKIRNEIQLMQNGEGGIPDTLFSFMRYLVQGPDTRRANSEEGNSRITSMCWDLISNVNKGEINKSIKMEVE